MFHITGCFTAMQAADVLQWCMHVCARGPLPRPGGLSLIYNACCSVKILKESLTHGNSSSDGGSINESMINITGEHCGIMDVSGKWIRTRGTLTCGRDIALVKDAISSGMT